MMGDDAKKEAIKGIYNLVTRRNSVSELDPQYTLIYEMLNVMPAKDIHAFYKFYATSKQYFNKEGFSSIALFQDALRDYKEYVSSTLWDECKIEEKAERFTNKILSIYEQLLKHLYANELKEKAATMKLDGIKQKNGDPLFDAQELAIVADLGLYRLIAMYMESGYFQLRDRLVKELKDRCVLEYFSKDDGDNGNAAMVVGSGTDRKHEVDTVSPKTQSLLGILAEKSRKL